MRRMMIVVLSLSVFAVACKKDDGAKADPKRDPLAQTDPVQRTNEKASDLLAGKDTEAPASTPGMGSTPPTDPVAGADKINPGAMATRNPSEEELITLMEKMAIVVEKHGKDCAQLGTQLKSFVEANRPMMEKLKSLDKTMSQEEKQAMGMRLTPRIMPLAPKLAPLMGCTADPAFKKILEGLPM
ncbi:MAG: hypothetical protein WKG01_28670 [Kofleriaceae bacterium]